MNNVLLIGGAGYVGTVITSHFLKLGYQVRALDNFVYRNQESIQSYLGDENYEFISGDLGDMEVLAKAAEGIHNVVILGGLVGDPITKKYPEASNKIFISTCSNYSFKFV